MEKEEYLEKRVKIQQAYFSKTARKNKSQYYWISIMKLIVSLGITVLSSFVVDRSLTSICIAVLSAVLIFLEAILLLLGSHEGWIMHRITSERLKREKYLFETGAGGYKQVNPGEAYPLFVENIEAIIQSNNEQWKTKAHEKNGG